MIVAELTVCCEASYEAARQRKLLKYLDIEEEARSNGYTTDLLTLEVGSSGFINTASFNDLRTHLLTPRREWNCFLQDISRAAIAGSYRIWTSRNHLPS